MKFNFNDGSSVELQGGSGNYIKLRTYVNRDYTDEHEQRFYIGVPSSFNVAEDGVSLAYRRNKKVRCVYHKSEEGEMYIRRNGWHSVPAVPVDDNRTPLVTPFFVSTESAFEKDGYSFYEVSFNEYDSVSEFLNSGDMSGYSRGGSEMLVVTLLGHSRNGICLMKDGEQISNFAKFIVSCSAGWGNEGSSYAIAV